MRIISVLTSDEWWYFDMYGLQSKHIFIGQDWEQRDVCEHGGGREDLERRGGKRRKKKPTCDTNMFFVSLPFQCLCR